MLKVIGIGDNVCDKYVHQKIMYPGGQALNFAVYARKLGAESAYLGAFGTDRVAEHVMKTLDQYQVDRSHCRQYEGENGFARVNLVDGDRVFLGSNKGGVLKEHPITLSEEDLDYLHTFRLCHTSNNSYMDNQLSRLKETGIALSYDFSGQWIDEERVARVAPYLDYAFLSCGAVSQERVKEICRSIHGQGAGMVVATRGSLGAMLYDGRRFYTQAPQLTEAVDTLGAGDSFATAFLVSWTESVDREGEALRKDEAPYRTLLQHALRCGAEFSSKTCLEYGAFGEGVPYQEEG